MSQSDLKHSLRLLPFPDCVREALPRIETLVMGRSKQNFAMHLISEFVFLEKSREGKLPVQLQGREEMTKLEEFLVIITLIDFFDQPRPESTRNAVFLSLFGTNLSTKRLKLLCNLISTSVSCSLATSLSAAGAWMQQVGCTTEPSLEVAKCINFDFISLSKKPADQLKSLPMMAPRFVANLMTALAHIFMNEQEDKLVAPPEMLLEIIAEWVKENRLLCMASHQPVALPPGAIAMPVVTPIAGLLRWTVLAPIVSDKPVYSELHYAILNTIEEISLQQPPIAALDAQHLLRIVPVLQKQLSHVTNPQLDNAYQKCMERFAQALQVAISFKCIYGNIASLVHHLEMLPSNALMDKVLRALKNAPSSAAVVAAASATVGSSTLQLN